MNFFVLFLLFNFIFFEITNLNLAEAKSSDEVYTIYQYPVAAFGQCLPEFRGSAEDILDRNGIQYRGRATDAEISALAKGIGQVENLLGKPLPRKWQTTYNYITSSNKTRWNQAVNAIHVRRPSGTNQGENIARLIHELGHKVGNSGEYNKYRRAIRGEECRISGYAAKKNNEQFAEVFAAFVTYPDLLAKKCPRAYAFFSQKLFPESEGHLATCSGNRSSTKLRPKKQKSKFSFGKSNVEAKDDESDIIYIAPGYHKHRKKTGDGVQ